ncbi:hypothetical protein AYI69_g8694 [Smittium culicis]|uniref:CCHC-type domain-containing protein n=1 Tax=Smittium culicis TaxID=133412 RepID=A0A1R1XHZ0_9FUNG|nr:hypothetical protein AYI69_g8694 [Smittium culicis]
MFKFEVFPAKFHGSSSDVMSIGIWISKAANWQFDMEQDEDTAEWTLSKWLKKMESHFQKIKDKSKKRDIFELAKMTMKPGETMVDFNKKFKEFVRGMEETMYTKELLKKTYVDMLSKIDNNIWWNLAQSVSNDSIEELMKKSIQLSEIKIAANIKESEVEEVKLKPEDKTVMKSIDKKIDDLMTAFGKIELLVQNSKPTNNPMSYTCYTCGEKGHACKYCRNWMTKERSKGIEENLQAMLAINSESVSPAFATAKIGHKRLRVVKTKTRNQHTVEKEGLEEEFQEIEAKLG